MRGHSPCYQRQWQPPVAPLLLLLARGGWSQIATEITCGGATRLDAETATCQADCGTEASDVGEHIYIGGVFDFAESGQKKAIFDTAMRMLRDRTDGWHDDLLDGAEIHDVALDGQCQRDVAVPHLWTLMSHWAPVLHGLVGPRCSGPAEAMAQIAGLEHIPQVSMSATKATLSDVAQFPYFFRVVAPDDETGFIGATVRLFQEFGWSRISMFNVDKPWAVGFGTVMTRVWLATGGTVEHTHTIAVKGDQTIDLNSLDQAFVNFPSQHKHGNSRVIMLNAHNQDAYTILKHAKAIDFQPDTIWFLANPSYDWYRAIGEEWQPDIPGYISMVPKFVLTAAGQDFLARMNAWNRENGLAELSVIPMYGPQVVDSVLAIAKALDPLPPLERANGTAVRAMLRELDFEGMTGRVAFTETGDLANPVYSVINQKSSSPGHWTDVGTINVGTGETQLDISSLCWAVDGCGLQRAPPDSYLVTSSLPSWAWALIVALSLVIVLGGVVTHLKRKASKERNEQRRQRILEDAEKAKDEALAAQKTALQNAKQDMDWPRTWKTQLVDGKRVPEDGLFTVPPTEPEYWDVFDKLRASPDATHARRCSQTGAMSDLKGMDDAWITTLQRIQNTDLFTFNHFQEVRMAKTMRSPNEGGRGFASYNHQTAMGVVRRVDGWHGTKSFNAANIYNDRQDGFMMQFASKGQWGAGLYFAKEPGYSDIYATKSDGMNGLEKDESEFMLATVSVGDVIEMDRDLSSEMREACNELVTPPLICSIQSVPTSEGIDAAQAPPRLPQADSSTQRYNTVQGYTQTDLRQQDGTWAKNPTCPRSPIWIVYENGRAYPNYLVRYMRGPIDRQRTPYASRAEAMGAADAAGTGGGQRRRLPPLRAVQIKGRSPQLPVPTDEVLWICQTDSNSGGAVYPADVNNQLEEAFNNLNKRQVVDFISDGFNYSVNIETQTQRNCNTGTERPIMRHVNGQPSGWITKMDPQTGRYYFLNRFESGSSTWTRNRLCPSVSFQAPADVYHNPLGGASKV